MKNWDYNQNNLCDVATDFKYDPSWNYNIIITQYYIIITWTHRLLEAEAVTRRC